MKIQMLLPIFDKWDEPRMRYGVLVVVLQRHEGDLTWMLNEGDVGKFSKSLERSIDFLENSYPQFKTLLVIKRIHVRLNNNKGKKDYLPYFEEDLTNTMDLETFKEYLKNGLYNIS